MIGVALVIFGAIFLITREIVRADAAESLTKEKADYLTHTVQAIELLTRKGEMEGASIDRINAIAHGALYELSIATLSDSDTGGWVASE